MPIVIFLAQRVILFLLGILTFLGLSSEQRFYETERAFAIQSERKPEVAEILERDDIPVITEVLDEPELDVEPVKTTPPTSTTPTGTPVDPQQETLPPDLIDTLKEEIDAIKEGINNIVGKDSADTVNESETASEEAESDPIQIFPDNEPTSAVLNLVCLETKSNSLSITTGSAVIISKTGYVLTNGHVAKNLFKQDRSNVDCELKHPDNKSMNFRVAIQYIPEEWTDGTLGNSSTGTGEKDYAVLKIVGPGPTGILPNEFPYIEPNTSDKGIYEGNDILLIAYPGKQAGVYEIDSNLPQVTDVSSIQDVYTFDKTSIDVFSSGITDVARQGSSGGAVVDGGKLLGIIVTTNSVSGGSILNALSLNYINRDLKSRGLSISSFK